MRFIYVRGLITWLLIFFSSHAFAQKNLVFNEYKYISLSGNAQASGISDTKTITVPTGTVWKVTGAAASRRDGGVESNPALGGFIYINDVRVSENVVVYPSGSAMDFPGRLPIWLPAGPHTIKLGGVTGNGSTSTVLSGFVNIVEFIITN